MTLERNAHFVGRELELARLEELLFRNSDQTAKAALIGLGGAGKTHVAIEFVYRALDRYKECSVFWIPATDSESLLQAYLAIADKLEIPGRDQKDVDVKSLLQTHLSSNDAGRWLIVFDNADDMQMWIELSGGTRRLVDYLPRSPHGSILFTTRDRRVAVKLVGRNFVEVPEMKSETAVELLQKSLADAEPTPSLHDAAALTNQLTNLPLAIVQTAAYINANGISVADYISLFAEQDETIQLLSEAFEDGGRYQNIKNPVATTWLISFERIQKYDALAADFLSSMACMEPKGILAALLPAEQSRKKEMDAIGTLTAYSFVIKKSNNHFDLHRLVHLAMQNWLKEHNLMDEWPSRTVTRMATEFPDGGHENRAIWSAYLPHAQYALLLKSRQDEARVRLLRKVGLCVLEDGRFNEAEVLLSEVLQASQRLMGDEHPRTLTSISNLATAYVCQGQWEKAEQLQVQAVEAEKKVMGDEHPDTLASIYNLAVIHSNQEKWLEAEPLVVQVTEIQKRTVGDENPLTLRSMAILASIFREQGRWTEAKELLTHVIEAQKQILGDKHPDMLGSMRKLSLLYHAQGHWTEAEQVMVQVIEAQKRVLGDEHPETLTCMNNLAYTLHKLERYDEAMDLMQKSVDSQMRKLGVDHPYTLNGVRSLERWRGERKVELEEP